MTSSSRYTSSTFRVDQGSPSKHLSEEDDVTGNSVTSPGNSLSVVRHTVSSPVSPGQSQTVFLHLSLPNADDDRPGLANGHESVLSPSEFYHEQQQQQLKVILRTSRAVSVPDSLQRDLGAKDEGHRRHFSEVVKLTLQPTSEYCFVVIIIIINNNIIN